MSRDYLQIGPCPAMEDAAQVGDADYAEKSMAECKAFIPLIRAKLGQEPEGARLGIKSFPHDFGSYREVVCYFDDDAPAEVEYAYRCEDESPTMWMFGGKDYCPRSDFHVHLQTSQPF